MSLALNNRTNAWTGGIEILTNGRVIDIEAVKSVWWRRPGEFGLSPELSEQERAFAKDEINHVLRGLWATLDCYWMSYPESIRQASWKNGQLLRAAQLGLDVPRTLITTSPEDARAFYEECNGQMIFKVMSDPFLAASKAAQDSVDQPPELYETQTTLVTESELALLESARLVPCLFQEYVPKQHELRVTVIGDDIFAAEIHSQADERTRIDWRNYDAEIQYQQATLPVEIAERCLTLVRSYNLNFSALDLVLTPDGRYVFIESNPNGQFIFVEERVPELRMTEALVACLVRGANS